MTHLDALEAAARAAVEGRADWMDSEYCDAHVALALMDALREMGNLVESYDPGSGVRDDILERHGISLAAPAAKPERTP